jgi:HTH-type transcriptional regulator/antitoxin HigA
MKKIEDEQQYKLVCGRINELLKVVNGSTPMTDPNMKELTEISLLAEAYEHEHYPVKPLTLAETIQLRMEENGLSVESLAALIGITVLGMKRIVSGSREPSLRVGRELSRKLNIEPALILGV